MLPFLSGSAFGGLGFLGDLIGLDQRESDQDQAVRTQNQNIALQKEFAQHGVTWRVEDAKRAGVHPLFALQGGGAAFAPNPIVVPEEPAVGRAFRAVGQDAREWQAQQMSLDVAAAGVEKDRAIAEYYRSEAARARQASVSAKPVIRGDPNVMSPMQDYFDVRTVNPNETVSRDSNFPSTAAGSSPAFRTYELMPGKVMDLPYSEEGPSESLENLTATSWAFVIAHNMQHYGPEWLSDMQSIITPWVDRAQARENARMGYGDFRSGGGPTGFE